MYTRLILLAVLFCAVANGHPYEQGDEEELPINDFENDDTSHHMLRRKHEGRAHNRRHKRYFLNHMGYQAPNAEYNNPGMGFYPPPMMGYCPPWPPQKPAEACPEKEILKELIKVMQNPPSIRITCETGNVNVTKTPDMGTRFGGDQSKGFEKEQNWGMYVEPNEMTSEEASQYERRDIDLNPYVPEIPSEPKLSKNARKVVKTRSTLDRCDFVYTACCNDEETTESCYKKNGCEKNYREGNACTERSKDELHRYIATSFKYRNGN